jgi:hypothetical protein
VLIGEPSPRNALRRLLQPSLPSRLLRALPGIDVRIVADRARREPLLDEEEAERL